MGKFYVTGFTDDRSRFRIAPGVYLHKSAKEAVDALRLALAEKRIPSSTDDTTIGERVKL